MTIPASQDPSFGFAPGDHVCAFYSSSQNVLDDIVVDYITKGLQVGNKVFCMVDQPSTVHSRVPAELMARDGMLQVLTEDEAYMPDGYFSKDAFIRNMETMVHEAFAHGYDSFRAVGDESFLVRNGVDIKEWFAAESELNEIVPDYPHFFSAFTTLTCSTAARSCMCSGHIRGYTSMASSSAIRITRQSGSPDSQCRQRSPAALLALAG